MSCSLCGQKVDLDLPDDALEQELCRRCWDEREASRFKCRYCTRLIRMDSPPEPDAEIICYVCEDERNDARRDAYFEKQWEERTGR
jgi:hypothetical protein